jgi:hypothetical protein
VLYGVTEFSKIRSKETGYGKKCLVLILTL